MASTSESLVSKSGQISVPAGVRRRWGLTEGGRVTVLQHRHRCEGRPLSAAMAEALAAAQTLGGAIAISSRDVDPNLKAAAEHDRVPFTILLKHAPRERQRPYHPCSRRPVTGARQKGLEVFGGLRCREARSGSNRS